MKNKNLLFFYIIILSTLLIQCQCGDGPTEPEKETIRPTVISTLPANNTNNVSINDSVIIVFSEKIQATTVTNISLFVANTISSVSLSDSIAIVTYASPLDYSTTYVLNVTTDVADLSGNRLATTFNSSFTTEADPATLPPTVVSTLPVHNGIIGNITHPVTARFSKDINVTTLNDTTFYNVQGRTGTITYDSSLRTAIFTPSSPWAYDSTYSMNLTTLIQDTNGYYLQALYSWTFTAPTITPSVSIVTPSDSLIIGDTITIAAFANNPIGIDTVQFYVDNILVGTENKLTTSTEYLLDASVYAIGSKHSFYAIAYDSLGNYGSSDTLTFFYLWQEVFSEGNDGFNQLQVPNDLRKMFIRSTDSTLELRYEYGYNWTSAYSDTSCIRVYDCGLGPDTVFCSDTAVDLGIYIDSDLNANTGRRDGAGDTLNDIGAEYRIILGLHGGDNAFSVWNSGQSQWNIVYDTLGFINHIIPKNSKYMEFGFKWSDINNPSAIDIVNVNVFFKNFCDPGDFYSDFMPDRVLNSHVRIYRENRYVGPVQSSSFKTTKAINSSSTLKYDNYINPFD